MPNLDFDAARRERLRHREPIGFTLGGQDFTCVPVVPLGVSWALTDVPDTAELLEETRPQALQRLAGLVADMLVPGDVERWWALFQSRDEIIDDQALFDLTAFLIGEYTGRPTSPSIGSSDGRETTGADSSSKVSAQDSASSAN